MSASNDSDVKMEAVLMASGGLLEGGSGIVLLLSKCVRIKSSVMARYSTDRLLMFVEKAYTTAGELRSYTGRA